MPKSGRWLVLLVMVCGLGLYLNVSYAHIFDKISMVGLTAPRYQLNYILGEKKKAARMVYMALGDSLTSGVGAEKYEQTYPYLVAQRLAKLYGGVTLENKSFPGATSLDMAKDPLKKTIEAQPQIITIMIGTNDIHGTTKATFIGNYREILNRLTQETGARIYVISVPYIGDASLMRWPYNFYFDWRVRSFNRGIKSLARQYGVDYIDLYTPTLDIFRKNGPHYSSDRFHPSAEGYAIWAPVIYDYLSR